MSETPQGIGDLAGSLLNDPAIQQSLIDMSKPLLETQERVLNNIIENENNILTVLSLVLESLEKLNKKLEVKSIE